MRRATFAVTALIAVHPGGDVDRGEQVTFDASGSSGAAQLVWDFDDGGQAVGAKVTHRFRTGGAYLVSLTARGTDGSWTSAYQEVRVKPYVADKVVEPVSVPSQGFDLGGTVTRPKTSERVPAIVEYGPYGAGGVSDGNWNRILVRSGYAYVKVAMPGKDRSGGRFDMFGASTARAGYDAIEWVARQSWCNGRVALAGFSGPAVAAMDTLTARPPHLVAASLKGAFGDFYRDMTHPGGIVSSNTFANGWNALFFAEPATTQTNTRWADVPTREADTASVAAAMNARPLYDDWWRERTFTGRGVDVPVLYYGTHRDLWPRAAPELLSWLRPAGGRVTMMYGGHGPVDPTGFAPSMHVFADGSYSGESLLGETRAWWDHWLKGVDNGVERRPAMSVLVPRDADWNAAAGSRWIGLPSWPAPKTRWWKLRLDGGGALAEGAPKATAPDAVVAGAGWGATGQAALDDAQSAAYTSSPLPADVTVVGPVVLRLFAALDGADLAFNVQLQEVLPDGSVRQVQDGQLQASHRALDGARTKRNAAGDVIVPWFSHDALDPPMPGQPADYQVEIPTVFNTFTRGSRIRVVVAGNDARPALDGHATAPQSARFTVHHDAGAPSALLLPAIDHPEALALKVPWQLSGR